MKLTEMSAEEIRRVYGACADDMMEVAAIERKIDEFLGKGYEDDEMDREEVACVNEVRNKFFTDAGWDEDPYPVEYREPRFGVANDYVDDGIDFVIERRREMELGM